MRRSWKGALRGLMGMYPPLDEAWAVIEELAQAILPPQSLPRAWCQWHV